MCILCVVQKWSRRVATMLPWLVIPLIVLWALSQLLPPGFRFEVTSPRLACVFVLLVTLFWYEVLMPQLSAWRVRRSAWLREQQRLEAMELEKLRKMATRRCRNCLTPYRDQNPGGGRFMCSYCGHTSRRPVLDMPVPANLGITSSGIGKILNGKVWSENGWICSQDWSENGNWVGGSLVGKSGGQWGRNGGAFFSGDDRCSAEKSYSGVFVFACKLLLSFFLSIRWLWRKIFRVGSASEDDSSEAEHKGLSKKGDNGTNLNESRGEKARRKAEEKRQARLEREMHEEEERKQREEVARLVEERRRLRDEKLEAEKERGKGLTPDRERDSRRETERRRQERRKEKDKGSSKSNSDGEEVERKTNRESERKREFDKRSEIERRDFQKAGVESIRAQGSEMGNGIKGVSSNFNRPNGGGSRYFDRMKGSFLSSSKAFNGASFFGRGAHTSNTITKLTKPSGSVDYVQTSGTRREAHAPENITGKFSLNGDDKVIETASHRPVVSDLQPKPAAPKKTWQQLFTRSPAGSSSSDANAMSRPNSDHQTEARYPQFDQASQAYNLSNPIQFALPLPFTPLCTAPMNSSVAPAAAGSALPLIGNPAHDFASEDAELFEDPCYVPDPVSLLGPVSESLDNFPLDLGTGFVTGTGLERPHVLKNVSASTEVNKPSPIESPMSRSRIAEEKHVTSGQVPCTLGSRDMRTCLDESGNAHEQGTWQIWGSPPLGQDGLGLVGGPASWLLPLGQNISNHEDTVHPSVHKAVTSHVPNENQVIPGSSSPQKSCIGNGHSGGTFSPLSSSSNDNESWLQKTVFQPLSGDGEKHFPHLHPREDRSLNRMTYDVRSKAGSGHSFEQSPANSWSKRDWAVHGQGEGEGNSTLAMPSIGGLFSTPDVQSLWSFN